MRAGHNAQRRVALVHRIQVHANRYHALQDFKRRLDLNQPGLDRPWAEPVRVDAFVDHDRAVLMPAERPVPLRRLVEQDRADRASFGPEHDSRDRADRSSRVEEGLQLRPIPNPHARHATRQRGQGSLKTDAGRLVQRLREKLGPTPIEIQISGSVSSRKHVVQGSRDHWRGRLNSRSAAVRPIF